MSVPSDKIDQKIAVGRVIVIAIPSFLTILVLILLTYLTSIVSTFNDSQRLNACRGRVSQEIQEVFRQDVSKLIVLAGQAADGKIQRKEQHNLLTSIKNRPTYVEEVKRRCGQDLLSPISTTTTTNPERNDNES